MVRLFVLMHWVVLDLNIQTSLHYCCCWLAHAVVQNSTVEASAFDAEVEVESGVAWAPHANSGRKRMRRALLERRVRERQRVGAWAKRQWDCVHLHSEEWMMRATNQKIDFVVVHAVEADRSGQTQTREWVAEQRLEMGECS